MKEFTIRMFFYFCLSFIFFILISVNVTFFVNSTTNLCSEKYMSVLILSFSKILYCSFIFCAENVCNSGIATDCSFFSIKLVWLNPKSDVNLIVSGFDNLVCRNYYRSCNNFTNLHRLFTAPESCCIYFALSNLLLCKFFHFFKFVFSLNFFINWVINICTSPSFAYVRNTK